MRMTHGRNGYAGWTWQLIAALCDPLAQAGGLLEGRRVVLASDRRLRRATAGRIGIEVGDYRGEGGKARDAIRGNAVGRRGRNARE
ncbi:hypothetical protein EV126DRAFT_408083 [Verticillium dahliae]|nr:hypothetical protein EV126DRAFT_408083 [Verticillium dahliae]